MRQVPLRLAIAGESIPLLPIAEMTLVILGMRCSEAAVEREFTLLRRPFGDHVQHLRGDLVEARLTIMMNNLDVSREFMRGFSQLEHEVLRRRPEADFPRSAPPLTVRVSSS
jgi:hypothetical protein